MNETYERHLRKKLRERKTELPDFVNEFLWSLELNKQLQTQLEYAKDIQLFLEYLSRIKYENKIRVKNFTLSDLERINESDIYGFLDYISEYTKEFISVGGNKTIQTFTNGPQGKERKRASVKSLYDYYMTRGRIQNNPLAYIQVKIEKQPIKPRLTSHEVTMMLETAFHKNEDPFRALRNHVILKILAYTGVRISELTDMNIDDIWDHRNEMVITRKGGKREVLYINQNIREDLFRYLHKRKQIENIQKGHESALFLSQQMRRINPRSVRKMIRVVADKSGITQDITPHTFRRTFGWKHYNDNKDLGLTAAVLGHESTETTRRNYANADEERINQSLDAFKY